MTLRRKKVRQLARTEGKPRDARLVWVFTEDRYAVKQYLEALPLKRLHVVVETPGEGARSLEQIVARRRALSAEIDEEDECWLVHDTDHLVEGAHQRELVKGLKQARDLGMEVALSRPCFEFWLWLHYGEAEAEPGNCEGWGERLRGCIPYDKRRLRAEDWGVERRREAMRRAREWDARVGGGEVPAGNTTRVYRLLEVLERWG